MARNWVSHRKIEDHLRSRIKSGALTRGERLPSFEQLHRQFGVAPGTVSRALTCLEADGLIERRAGSGVYVRHVPIKRRVRLAMVGGDPNYPSDFWMQMWAGIQHGVRSAGAEIIYSPHGDDMGPDDCDGLLCYSPSAALAQRVQQQDRSVPAVMVANPLPGVPSVSVDQYMTGYLAASHLRELDHRRIGFLGWLQTPHACLRLAGFHAAGASGLDQDAQYNRYRTSYKGVQPSWDDRLVHGLGWPLVEPKGDAGHAYMTMNDWLDNGFGKLACTALIVHNDGHASGVMRSLIEHGYRIPDDISVIGFDNERDCATMTPPLTSVGADMFRLGSMAVAMLMDAISGLPVKDVTIPVSLTVRESTGPPKVRP